MFARAMSTMMTVSGSFTIRSPARTASRRRAMIVSMLATSSRLSRSSLSWSISANSAAQWRFAPFAHRRRVSCRSCASAFVSCGAARATRTSVDRAGGGG